MFDALLFNFIAQLHPGAAASASRLACGACGDGVLDRRTAITRILFWVALVPLAAALLGGFLIVETRGCALPA